LDNRLTLLNGRKATRLRDQELPDLARAIAAYWNNAAKVGTQSLRGTDVVHFTGTNVDMVILKEDWEIIKPKLLDGTLTSQVVYPTHSAEEYILDVLKLLFTDKYPEE
jgi:hypothetical protein